MPKLCLVKRHKQWQFGHNGSKIKHTQRQAELAI